MGIAFLRYCILLIVVKSLSEIELYKEPLLVIVLTTSKQLPLGKGH
jgi:hypothetical protein